MSRPRGRSYAPEQVLERQAVPGRGRPAAAVPVRHQRPPEASECGFGDVPQRLAAFREGQACHLECVPGYEAVRHSCRQVGDCAEL